MGFNSGFKGLISSLFATSHVTDVRSGWHRITFCVQLPRISNT